MDHLQLFGKGEKQDNHHLPQIISITPGIGDEGLL